MTAPVDPSTITVECAEPRCDATTTADKLPGKWQATNDPEEVVLCPSCKERVPDKKRTPSEVREQSNQQITEWSA